MVDAGDLHRMVDVIDYIPVGRPRQSSQLILQGVPGRSFLRIKRVAYPVLLGPAFGLKAGISQGLRERIRQKEGIEIDLYLRRCPPTT